MIIVIRLLLAFELTATMVEEVVPPSHGMLPLGGSNLAQLGIALVLAVLMKEVWDAYKEARTVWRRRRRAERRRQLEGGRKVSNAALQPDEASKSPADAQD